MLQWGHGVEPVEIERKPSGRKFETIKLQWGHGVEPVEMGRWAGFGACRASRFNGATGLNPWRFKAERG